MLAVQRPSMGSSKPPNLEMPFGCIFSTHNLIQIEPSAHFITDSFDDSGSNHPYPSPTAPAPGPSLLDDNESRFLDNFFDGVSSDQFSCDLFNLDDGTNLGLGWEDLPPKFVGTSTTYGQPSQTGSHNGFMGLDFAQINSHLIHNPSINSSETTEILQAATLLQNTPNRRPQDVRDGVVLRNREVQFLPPNESVEVGSIPQSITVLQSVFEPRPSGDCYTTESIHTDVFDDHSSALICDRPVNDRADLRWGSDASFATPQGFITPYSRESVSAVEKYHLQAIQTALSPAQDPDTAYSVRSEARTSPISHRRMNSIGQSSVEDDQGMVTSKRRKIEVKDEDDDDMSFTSPVNSKLNTKKRKIYAGESVDLSASEYGSSHKRRKSTTSVGTKPIRENLTEEQKRENHIKSEQKRRTLIREGFEDLNELVPGLQGGGFSKSAVLAQAADWLEELIRGNEKLRAKILLMEGRATNGTQ